MLYNLLTPLVGQFHPFNLFNYISFRSFGAFITALTVCLLFGGPVINWLRSHQKNGQPIRGDGPPSHIFSKQGTPTMGGTLLLLASLSGILLWANVTSQIVWAFVSLVLAFALIGAMDDVVKLSSNSARGTSSARRLVVETAVALIFVAWFLWGLAPPLAGEVAIPFLKTTTVPLGWLYLLFGTVVIVGTANAVNLTDGLDGLAIVPAIICFACFTVVAWLTGNKIFANYLNITYVAGVGELTVAAAAIIGAGLGFLWFNAPPARVFMGDTGSLATGAGLGALAVLTRSELLLLIIGGLFVLEALSVIVQVASFRLFGKRVFKMAPLHHHFEQKGWSEATIVIRFWIIAALLGAVGLATLKIR